MSTSVVFARMKKEDVELLKRICEARGEDLSDFVRRAIYKELASLSFLSEEQKKALGMFKND
ncbi:MAG: ribbon-helix-helix protein, CopG family [Candidatus Aenigmatarchaeota archaeon]